VIFVMLLELYPSHCVRVTRRFFLTATFALTIVSALHNVNRQKKSPNMVFNELSNFKVRPLGRAAALVTYSAKYEGSYDKSPLDMKTLYGEVWVRSGRIGSCCGFRRQN
jgi:hypothetical protein